MAETTHFMDLALEEAQAAASRNEVPIGAVLVLHGRVIARSGNRTRELNDVTAHAEIAVIRMACEELGQERLTGADLYVTLEPCTMCAAAISFARIRRLYYGAQDTKGGAVESGVRFFNQPTCHHAPEVYSGFSETQARDILQTFFQQRRAEP
ncbi:nucleoside deaminase [Agrobacterium sp. rho-8.1]|jgi:tRNA(Arg) A34 adenosine deaminase TadA|nr:nucleoside deaminase [Agrobacterium sp. rho-8.1]